ncbi:MAG: universal stress protein [Methanomicrobia archaeon]|nr:universal stress protein [Methanomicrobia archaeon]
MYKRILVAMDSSNLAKKALSKAIDLAKLTNSEIYLVNVIEKANPENTAKAESIINEAEGYAETQGMQVKRFIKVGEPPDEVVFLAMEEKVDLIALGERGETGIRRLLLGSTAQEVIRFARCSVLVVK